MKTSPILIKNLGIQDYLASWQAMQDFTKNRDEHSQDQLWLLEHPAVYTLGRNGKEEHLLEKTSIPLIQVDRGGQITYHGPGQVIIYCLVDLQRRKLGVRQFVTIIEQSIIELLENYGVRAYSDKKAPGVYVYGAKIAALGIRVSRGSTMHGLSLNVDMDLSPFESINPCGYQGLKVTQCCDLGIDESSNALGQQLSKILSLKITNSAA